MPAADKIRIDMCRRGKVQVWHWMPATVHACGKAEAKSMRWCELPATDVAISPALCSACRKLLLEKRLIVAPQKAETASQ